MAARISTEITKLGRSCRFLLTALIQQGGQVADLLLEKVGPYRKEGDQEPGFLSAIVALGRRLDSSMERLVKASRKVYTLNASLSALRKHRDRLTPTLATGIVRLRRLVQGQYAEPDLEALSLQSPRVRTADKLLSQSGQIEEVFASDNLEQLLGDSAFEGEKVDPRQAAAQTAKTAEELRSILVKIDEMQRELDPAIIEKDDIQKEHGEIFVYTARSFEAQCRLAGLRKLADKVRPSEEQRGRRAQEVEDPPAHAEPADNEPDVTEGFVFDSEDSRSEDSRSEHSRSEDSSSVVSNLEGDISKDRGLV